MVVSNYVGKAGQLAVMAEFLLRGYNVAMPEADVGDVFFVVEDLLTSWFSRYRTRRRHMPQAPRICVWLAEASGRMRG
jgi:hypothetical protein